MSKPVEAKMGYVILLSSTIAKWGNSWEVTCRFTRTVAHILKGFVIIQLGKTIMDSVDCLSFDDR